MFFKNTHQTFNRAINGLKKGIYHGYHHAKNISNNIHQGVTTLAHVYNAVAPVLKHYVPEQSRSIHHTVSNLASGYNSLRSKVIEADHHVHSVSSKLGGLI